MIAFQYALTLGDIGLFWTAHLFLPNRPISQRVVRMHLLLATMIDISMYLVVCVCASSAADGSALWRRPGAARHVDEPVFSDSPTYVTCTRSLPMVRGEHHRCTKINKDHAVFYLCGGRRSKTMLNRTRVSRRDKCERHERAQ